MSEHHFARQLVTAGAVACIVCSDALAEPQKVAAGHARIDAELGADLLG
jgi:ribosomal protein S27E